MDFFKKLKDEVKDLLNDDDDKDKDKKKDKDKDKDKEKKEKTDEGTKGGNIPGNFYIPLMFKTKLTRPV